MNNVGNLTNSRKIQRTVKAAIQPLKANACAEITVEKAAFSRGQGEGFKALSCRSQQGFVSKNSRLV